MRKRLLSFAAEHDLSEEALKTLEGLIHEVVLHSIELGHSVLDPPLLDMEDEPTSRDLGAQIAAAMEAQELELAKRDSEGLLAPAVLEVEGSRAPASEDALDISLSQVEIEIDLDLDDDEVASQVEPGDLALEVAVDVDLDVDLDEDEPDEALDSGTTHISQEAKGAGHETTLSLRSRARAAEDGATSPSSSELTALPPLSPEERYEVVGKLGAGGMGRVQRVRDWRLNRIVAMKILHPTWLTSRIWLRRFIEEAQATARLQHPGIVPVHDLGQFEDGRFYFTMKEVEGRTLSEIIKELHESVVDGRWQPTPSGWTFRRAMDAFNRVCEAVAYAHNQGVLHRDLKPENVMVGEHGEVKVLDWGLVKLQPRNGEEDHEAELLSLSHDDKAHLTQFGEVKGTPAYMSPEQASGDIDQIGPHTDVYGLGALLYEILSGRPPFQKGNVRAILYRILSEKPPPPGRIESGQTYAGTYWEDQEIPHDTEGPSLSWALVRICGQALSRNPEDRFSNAGEMAHEIEQWLEGAQKQARALELVDHADTLAPSAAALRSEAEKLRNEAALALSKIKSWESEEKKYEGWDKQDQATRLEWEAWLKELEAEHLLQSALSHVRDLEAAHSALIARYTKLHREAETDGRDYSQMRAERFLQGHASALPEYHPAREGALTYLSGEGALSLETDPPGASVQLYRYVPEHRKLKPVFVRFLGETPLHEVRLGMGSYLLVLRKEGYEEARYPIMIERMEHWTSTPPGAEQPMAIQLFRHKSLPAIERYVPAGWFWSGGDPDALNSLPRRRLWVDGFVIQRFAVTNTQYIAFLDDLVSQGREAEALRYAPRERSGSTEKQGALIYGRTLEGGFVLRPDTEGDIWYPNYPALMIDWFGAQAYARWFSEKTRKPWRLPSELEWEKAARGVDGRLFPWGDFLDPTWCCMRDSRPGRALPAVVGSFEVDQSPYGVREMAGNVRDWCLDIFKAQGPITVSDRVQIPVVSQRPDDTIEESSARILRVRRGGGWDLSDKHCRVAGRDGDDPTFRDYMSGFRLVRSLW